MRIIKSQPPIYTDIIAAFPEVANAENPMFTFGDTIYNPSGNEIPPYAIAHEEVHEKQQKVHGIKQWWWTYLRSPEFRLEQELEAYRVEYRAFCKIYKKNRKEQFKFLLYQAKMLSSPFYGNLLSTQEAMAKIKV